MVYSSCRSCAFRDGEIFNSIRFCEGRNITWMKLLKPDKCFPFVRDREQCVQTKDEQFGSCFDRERERKKKQLHRE